MRLGPANGQRMRWLRCNGCMATIPEPRGLRAAGCRLVTAWYPLAFEFPRIQGRLHLVWLDVGLCLCCHIWHAVMGQLVYGGHPGRTTLTLLRQLRAQLTPII